MKFKDIFIGAGISIILVCFLFYKSIFYGAIPFPGDSLLSHFKPWQVTSYDGYGAGGIPNKAQYPDVIRQMYPWRIEAIRQWKEGNVPLWNPYSFSGTPLLANFQSASLYPFNTLFLFLRETTAWTVLIALQPLLAIFFTFLYLRIMKLSILASLFGGISYGISGFMTVWLEYNTVGHIMAWFPLALYAIEHFNPTLLTISITLSLLSGHPQVALYAILFTSIYAAFRLQGKNKLYALLSLFVGFGISAVQLVPGIELLSVAARANHSYEQMMKTILIQPWQILMAFFPNLYGNPVSRTYWPLDTYVGKVTSIGLIPLFFFFLRYDSIKSLSYVFMLFQYFFLAYTLQQILSQPSSTHSQFLSYRQAARRFQYLYFHFAYQYLQLSASICGYKKHIVSKSLSFGQLKYVQEYLSSQASLCFFRRLKPMRRSLSVHFFMAALFPH